MHTDNETGVPVNDRKSAIISHCTGTLVPGGKFDRPVRWCFWFFLASMSIVLALVHEPWRDEVHALVASQFSWQEYVSNVRGITFPGFSLFWWSVGRIFDGSIIPGKVVAALISTVTAYLVIFKLRLPKIVAFPVLTSFYLAYEYTVFASREHPIVAGAVVLFTWLEIEERHMLLRLALVAFLLLCHPLSFVIGGSYLGYLVLSNYKGLLKNPQLMCGFFVAALAAALKLWWTMPRFSGQVARFTLPRWEYALFDAFAYMGKAFFGFSRNWNAYEYDLIPACLFGVMLGGILAVLPFLKTKSVCRLRALSAAIGFAGAVAGILTIFIFRYGGQPRHVGLVYCVTLSYVVILKERNEWDWHVDPRKLRCFFASIWAVSCLFLTTSSVFLIGKDVLRPFSQGKAVADYLENFDLESKPIAVLPDWSGMTVAAYLPGTDFYWGGSRGERNFSAHTEYFDNVYRAMTNQERIDVLPQSLLDRGVLIVLADDMGSELNLKGKSYRKVASFAGAIVKDENYYVYRQELALEENQRVEAPPAGTESE